MNSITKPRFMMHDHQNHHQLDMHREWRSIHEQIIKIITDLGYELEITAPGSPPVEDPNVIFFGKHTKTQALNYWNIKKAYLPHYVYFDRMGYSGWAELAERHDLFDEALTTNDTAATEFFDRLQGETIGANASKFEQPNTFFSMPKGRFVFMPLQLSYDSVIALSRIDFVTYYELVRNWAASRQLNLVVKPHPSAAKNPITANVCQAIQKVLRDAEMHSHVYVTSDSIHQIIPRSEAVFCINSGVGFEALIHLKSVITAGHSDYHWATHSIRDRADIEKIDDIAKPKLGEKDTKRFLHYFLNNALVDTRDPDRVRSKIDTVIKAYWQR